MDGDGKREEGAGGSKRLPYEAPSIAWEESLPARPGLTMACAKIDPSLGGECTSGAPSS